MTTKAAERKHRILCVVSDAGGGDCVPLLAVVQKLESCGHDIVIVCDPGGEDDDTLPGQKLSLPLSFSLSEFVDPALENLFFTKGERIDAEKNPLVLWGELTLDYVQRNLGSWRPSVVVTSLFTMGLGQALAAEYSVPRCLINPGCDFFSSRDRFKESDFSSLGALMYRHWLLPLASTAELFFHATDSVFDMAAEQPVSTRHVGPLFWEKPVAEPDWVQKAGPPWVLVTLSTSPQPGDLAIARTAVAALADFDLRLLVTLSKAHDRAKLGSLAGNVHVSEYVAHSRVLPQSCLVISHGGHGIVMKAMYHGVPMVLVPWGRDQPGVAMRAQRLGVAKCIAADRFSVQSLGLAVRDVLENEEYQRACRSQKARLRATVPGCRIAAEIDRLLEARWDENFSA